MKERPYTVIARFDEEPGTIHSLHVEGLDPYEARGAAKERLVLEGFGYDSAADGVAQDPDFDMERECEGITILYTFPGHIHSED